MFGELLALGAAVAFAVNSVFIQRGLVGSTPEVSTFVGNGFSALFLLIGTILLWAVGQFPEIHMGAVTLFATAGIFTTGLGRFAEAFAINSIGANRTASVRMLDPLFGYALSIAFLGDVLELRAVLGIILVIFGLQYLSGDGKAERDRGAEADRTIYFRGMVIAIICSLLYAGGNILRKAGMMLMPSAMVGSMIAIAVGFFMSMFVVVGSAYQREQLRTIGRTNLRDFAISAVGVTFGQYLLMAALGISTIPVVLTLRNTAPWFTMILGVIFLGAHSRITGRLAISTLLVMAGVGLVIFR